jgi:hypothetical protein
VRRVLLWHGDGVNEQDLQREAAAIIGTGEEILAAAIFGLQDD